MKTIALVTCVADKRAHPAPAKDLYIGPLFESFIKEAIDSKADDIFILSGKHHLLELDTVIEPYDVNLNLVSDTKLKAWAETVLNQLESRCDLNNDRFVLIANPVYLKYIIPKITHYSIPVAVE